MTALNAADRLRHLLIEAARNADVDIYPDTLAAIIDAQMQVFAQVTVQTRNLPEGCDGRMSTQHRLVALTPFQPTKDTPHA